MTVSLLDADSGISTWQVVEDRFVPLAGPGWESVFTIANGYLSTRGSFEERTPGEIRATFIQGLFVTPPRNSHCWGRFLTGPGWCSPSTATRLVRTASSVGTGEPWT